MKTATVFVPFLLLFVASADVLQNPSFELQPSKWAPNATVPSVPLNESNTIPGWTSQGSVEYYLTTSLPANQHAILLASDGKINQTFTATGDVKHYLLTFNLALGMPSRGAGNCSANISLVISAPDRDSEFFMKPKYGKEQWNVYGLWLGSWGNGEPVDLLLQSQNTEPASTSTCWPIVDNLVLKTLELSSQPKDNLLHNGGFELGPAFIGDSSYGVLLDAEPSLLKSALAVWSILGTIRYIDSKHYYVPEGNAAIELILGDGEVAGVQTIATLTDGSTYNLEFMLGDAHDSCKGDLTVGVQAGTSTQNFTIQSEGTGSANKYSMTFKAGSPPNSISFQSYVPKQSANGISCGPLVDSVVLRPSGGHISNSLNNCTFTMLLLLHLLHQLFNLLF